jgi:hypothetical protein
VPPTCWIDATPKAPWTKGSGRSSFDAWWNNPAARSQSAQVVGRNLRQNPRKPPGVLVDARFADDQHRAVRVVDGLMGNRAEQHSGESAVAA